MTTLVTGGCGFIGSHLTEALVGRGERVRVFDSLSTGREENLCAVADHIEMVRGDIRDYQAVQSAMQGVEKVYHLAALVSPFDSVDDPHSTHEVNSTGTLHVLEAARRAGARKVVLASSCSVYGNDPGLPKTETMTLSPESPYAATKLYGEKLLEVFGRLFGMQTVSLRYFNVFGPRQDPSSAYAGVISKFFDAFKKGRTPIIFGDGLQTRDFVFVSDVVAANLAAMDADTLEPGAIVNVGTGRQTSLLAILEALEGLFEKKAQPEFFPVRPGDVRHSVADVSKARSLFGFSAQYPLAAGLSRMMEKKG
ncbi:MAG: NAD-dependent epimerase/dehydratase family protein [Thermodesulfobacteriota bacterium]